MGCLRAWKNYAPQNKKISKKTNKRVHMVCSAKETSHVKLRAGIPPKELFTASSDVELTGLATAALLVYRQKATTTVSTRTRFAN